VVAVPTVHAAAAIVANRSNIRTAAGAVHWKYLIEQIV